MKASQDAIHSLLVAGILFLTGCDDLTLAPQPPAPGPKKTVKKKILTPKPAPKKVDADEELRVIEEAYERSHSLARPSGSPEELVVIRITGEIEKYVEVGPTLVAWLVDRTSSSVPLTHAVIPAVKQFYQSDMVKEWTAGGDQPLLSVVAALDDKVELLLDPPSDDPKFVIDALDKITPSAGGKELPFAAVKQILERYQSEGAARRQVVVVLITDEAGDDVMIVDELVPRLQKHVIPVYAIGYPAPWGQSNPFLKAAEAETTAGNGSGESPDTWLIYGPESRYSERVHLPLPAGGFGFRSAELDDLVESGFGPFGIEWLCRAGGGAFFPVRRSGGSFVAFGGTRTWPTGAEASFEPKIVSRYAPDYVSADEYKKLLAASRARAALHAAAKIGRVDILDRPTLSFPKAGNEAEMKRQLDAAQQLSARVAPQLDRLYDTLLPGEVDRDQLTGPRWQAEFDYALGRVLAAKARNDGYNQMVAALKAGKGPKQTDIYVLEPADSYETSSALRKMADKAKMYLERVVKEHPGTPWSKFAEEDLKVPMGWKWQGSEG